MKNIVFECSHGRIEWTPSEKLAQSTGVNHEFTEVTMNEVLCALIHVVDGLADLETRAIAIEALVGAFTLLAFGVFELEDIEKAKESTRAARND